MSDPGYISELLDAHQHGMMNERTGQLLGSLADSAHLQCGNSPRAAVLVRTSRRSLAVGAAQIGRFASAAVTAAWLFITSSAELPGGFAKT